MILINNIIGENFPPNFNYSTDASDREGSDIEKPSWYLSSKDEINRRLVIFKLMHITAQSVDTLAAPFLPFEPFYKT